MDESKAHTIIAALASGVDPITGLPFAADSPYQAPDIVRALYVAAQALDGKGRRVRARGDAANAGTAWSEDEDRRLLAQLDSGRSVQELARAHGRTVAGIEARLERHGRLQPQAGQKRSRLPSNAARNPPLAAARGRNSTQ